MLEGNIRASIDLAQPHRSSANGTLVIEGLDLGDTQACRSRSSG